MVDEPGGGHRLGADLGDLEDAEAPPDPPATRADRRLATGKSTRHSQIAGDFGEALILYWLSRNGWESVRVDHTGLDVIAVRPGPQPLRIGISVKMRTRTRGLERSQLDHPRPQITALGEAALLRLRPVRRGSCSTSEVVRSLGT